jgi:MFS family permease
VTDTNAMDTPSEAQPVASPERLNPQAKKAVRGAWFGLFVDYFDIYLPIVALAPAIGYFMAAGLSPAMATTFSYTLFAASFLGRPIGTFIFGHFGDRIGRKRTTLIAAGGVTVTTVLTGLLPGYGAAGVWALVLLTATRLIGGIFMGGQYTSANPLAIEATPRRLRGPVGGIIAGAYPFAYVAISLITYFLLAVLNGGAKVGPYQDWGWRIPFLLGGLLSLAFFFYYRREVEESRVWEETAATKSNSRSPLAELFQGGNRRAMVQVFVLMTGLWFGIQMLTSATPALLISYLGQPSQAVTWGLLVANLALGAFYPVFGILGQRFGRRRMLMVAGLGTAVISSLLYALMVRNVQAGGSFLVSMALVAVCLILTVAPNAMVVAYLCERFPTSVRSSGYGIGYTLAVVIPSFYNVITLQLGQLMPYQFTPVALLVVAGVLTIVGAAMGPETNSVDLRS